MTVSLVQSFKELENDKQNLASRGRHRGALLCYLSDRWLTLLSPELCAGLRDTLRPGRHPWTPSVEEA